MQVFFGVDDDDVDDEERPVDPDEDEELVA
jgi:hypothetical protein